MLGLGASNSISDRALGWAARAQAQRGYRRLLRQSENAIGLQERVLQNLIRSNAKSDFGREHRFNRIRAPQDFRAAVPVRDYEQLRPYMEKVMHGHEQALFGPQERLLMFAMTSGSTDKPKYIPVTRRFVREYRRGWNAFGGKALLDHPQAFMRTILQVTSPLDVERSPRGLPCGSISGLLAREQPRIVRRYYAAPPEVAQIADTSSRYYAIMRFAIPRDVAWIVTASPATTLKLARTASDHAESLIRDVHDGALNPPDSLSSQAARSLKPHLKPDPRTALRLEKLLARSGALLPSEFWNLAFLANWTGGTLALHLPDFSRYFGATPVRDIGLLATEGRVSIGLCDGAPTGLMDCSAGFFEFAELESTHINDAKQCHELDTGGVYRVILTNTAGLYRYDIGDCVRVAGFQSRCPILEFLHRGSRVCSMSGEKLSEWQVTTALRGALASLTLESQDFVVAPVWDDPPYYRLYLVVEQRQGQQIAARFDEQLALINMEYAGKRASQRLGPVRLQQVPLGAFQQWERGRMQVQHASEQYKPQYLLTVPGEDQSLLELWDSMGTPREPDTEMVCPQRHQSQAAHR